MITKISESLKAYGSAITTLFAIVATIGGGVLYVGNNFANAQDVKSIIRNQSIQIEMYQRSQKDNLMFRLEFYDREIAKLQEQKRIADERAKNRSQSRAIEKTPQELQEEITELKSRREMIKKNLIESEKLVVNDEIKK